MNADQKLKIHNLLTDIGNAVRKLKRDYDECYSTIIVESRKEDFPPELVDVLGKDCICTGNAWYYWAEHKGEVLVYTRTSLPLEKCPKEIIVRLLNRINERTKAAVERGTIC